MKPRGKDKVFGFLKTYRAIEDNGYVIFYAQLGEEADPNYRVHLEMNTDGLTGARFSKGIF